MAKEEGSVLKVSPMEPEFKEVAGGGEMHYSLHKVENQGKERVSVKIKCSDNEIYRLRPVFLFVEAGKTSEFTVGRILGKPLKKDKLILLYCKAETAKDPSTNWEDKAKKGDGQFSMWLCRVKEAKESPKESSKLLPASKMEKVKEQSKMGAVKEQSKMGAVKEQSKMGAVKEQSKMGAVKEQSKMGAVKDASKMEKTASKAPAQTLVAKKKPS